MTGKPALLDLADLNVAHWQSSSDQRNILHVARVPILFAAGLDEDASQTLEIGPNRIIYGPQGATLAFVEHTGNAIAAGRQDLEDLKQDMSTMGTELLVKRTGGVTATEKAIDSAAGDSALASIARALNNALSTMLDYMGEWDGGREDCGSLATNTDFRVAMDAADLDTLMKARQAGDLSRETFWIELSRRNILNGDFDPEDEADKIDNEAEDALNRYAEKQAELEKTAGKQPQPAPGQPQQQPPQQQQE